MIKKDSIQGPLYYLIKQYGFYSTKKTPNCTNILPFAQEEFKRLLYHRKIALAVIQIVYGLKMNPTNIRPLYNRAIVKEKAILAKALLKMIILEVEKTKSTLIIRLLEAQQRVNLANQGFQEEYLQDISICQECKSNLCYYWNKGSICQVNQGIYYKIARNWLNLQAKKCKSGNKDSVFIQNPLLQIKHKFAAISLKEVKRGHMRLKQEEKKARFKGKSRSYSRN